MKNIHIGNIIRQKVEESGLSVAQFAFHINRTRTTVYDIFNRKSIDVDLLISISEVLNFNFLKEVYLKEEQTEIHENEVKTHFVVNMEMNEQQLQKFAESIGIVDIINIIEKNKNK